MSALVLTATRGVVPLREIDREQLRTLVEAGGIVYWDWEGTLGKLSNAVLRQALDEWDDWTRVQERRPDVRTPDHAAVLRWDQTITPRDPSGPGQAPPLQLRPQPPSRGPTR